MTKKILVIYKMDIQFLDFNTLEQDVIYTVQSMQYIHGSAGCFYIIKITKPDNTVYYMNIQEKSLECNTYEKLETIKTGTQKNCFSFTKILLDISQDVSAPFIIISGENEVVNLN
jgi:hypothetical protein